MEDLFQRGKKLCQTFCRRVVSARELLLSVGLITIVLLTTPRVATSQATVSTDASTNRLNGVATNPLIGTTKTLSDPALTMGTLPNGMRYYLRVNKTPAKRAILRLAVNAGSLQEDDDQQGFAHFLEHMAFNGTKTFPRNTLIDFVEGVGMTFGGHLNAYTSFDETVYMLTVPTDNSKTLQQGLQVLEEWANGGILNDSVEVVAERGVVLGEWRTRMQDTAFEGASHRQLVAILGDSSRYLRRMPIGKPALLETATPAPLKRFYRDWYRPDLMALVVVGDFDKAAVERIIKTRFGKIPAATHRRERPSVSVPTGAPIFKVLKGAYNPSTLVLWRQPSPPNDPRAAVRAELVQQFVQQQLNRTFSDLRMTVRRPFVLATVGSYDVVRAIGEPLALNVITYPDSLLSGLTASWVELERLAQHGIPTALLERQKARILRQLESRADQATAFSSDYLANQYVQHYLTGRGILLSPQQELALARELLPTITPTDIAQAAARWRDSTQRTVVFHLPLFASTRPPTKEEISTLSDSIQQLSLTPMIDSVVAGTSAGMSGGAGGIESAFRHIAKPVAGTVVSEQRHKASGITEWTLSNGARVLYKPTQFNPDELIIHAKSQGGASRLPDSLFYGPGRLVAAVMTEAAGVGDVTRTQLRDQLSNSVVREFRVGLSATSEEMVMSGSPRDLETIFQMLYLQWTKPNVDSSTLERWKRIGEYNISDYDNVNDQIARALNARNRNLAPLSPALVQLIRSEEVLAVYQDRFGDASDFTFVIVGAAPVEQVKPLVLQYIATLPSTNRSIREQPVDPKTPPFESIVRRELRTFSTLPRAATYLVFDGTFPTVPEDYLRKWEELQILSNILNRRLRIRLREQLSATYGVGVGATTYVDPTQRYRFEVSFVAAPERINDLIPVVEHQLDSLRTVGVTKEELDRAVLIQQRQLENQLLNNRTWVSRMHEYDALGIDVDRILSPFSRNVTVRNLQSAAQQLLPTTSYIQLTFLPKKQENNKGDNKDDKKEQQSVSP